MPADVIVVGAGVAGLTAARDLAREGRKVLVIEARDRVGGRIWTRREPRIAQPIELGAGFVHGGNEALGSLLRDAHLPLEPVPERHWIVKGAERSAVDDGWERITRILQRIGPQARGDFAAWWHNHAEEFDPRDRTLVTGLVNGFHAAPSDRMSVATLYRAAAGGPEEQFGIRGKGYDEIVDLLSSELTQRHVTIRLGEPVEAIRWQKGSVDVQTLSASTYHAAAVVITVPLGVLQERRPSPGVIRFNPDLGQKRELWEQLGFGHAVRITFQFQANVWSAELVPADLRADEGRAFGFVHAPESVFATWWAAAPEPLLVGWAGGPAARALYGLRSNEIFRLALRDLAAVLRCTEVEVTELMTAWHLHDWSMDPYSRGAYSFATAGREDGPARLAEPVEETIFFAGEATADPLDLGTVHGAVASGERVAREVGAALPQAVEAHA